MNNEIKHHGIKGMRWGVRRYQSKDGSLTSAGRKRQSDGISRLGYVTDHALLDSDYKGL